MIDKTLMALNQEYHNAVAVFGGAYWAHQAIISGDFDQFAVYLVDVIKNAKFYKWHESIPETLCRFCNICLVDPALVESYLGIKFSELQ